MKDEKMWDIFISHASEDKDSVARPLALKLEKKGLEVWFDENTLNLGDSLHRSINRGLSNSRYGAVILSKSFFAKEWPKKELDGLVSKENDGDKVILPIWHEITRDEIFQYSPTLADRVAVKTEPSLDFVVEQIIKAIEEKDQINSSAKVEKTQQSAVTTRENSKKILEYLLDKEPKDMTKVMPDSIKTALNLNNAEFDASISHLKQIDAVLSMNAGHFLISGIGKKYLENYNKSPDTVTREEIEIINAKIKRISEEMLTEEKLVRNIRTQMTQRGIR